MADRWTWWDTVRTGVGVMLIAISSACGSSDDGGEATPTTSPEQAPVGDPTDAAPTSMSVAPALATTIATTAFSEAPATPTSAATTIAQAIGWAVHDEVASEQSGAVTTYDGVSCDSEHGPWHLVASFDVVGNVTQDVFYDVELDADGTGTLTGEEHTTWDDGSVIDGSYVGTARLSAGAEDGTFSLTLDYDESISIADASGGTQTQAGHRTKTLVVGPASGGDCG